MANQKQATARLTAWAFIIFDSLCFWLMWNFRVDGVANLFFLPEVYIVILAFNVVIFAACKKPQWATPVIVLLLTAIFWSSI